MDKNASEDDKNRLYGDIVKLKWKVLVDVDRYHKLYGFVEQL